MNTTLKIGTALALLLAATPMAAMGQGDTNDPAVPTVPTPTQGDAAGNTGAAADVEPGMALGTPVKNPDDSINTSQLIGLEVQSTTGENVGEIGEVVLDSGGEVQGVVIDVGGFLGVGTHPVLLGWQDVTLAGSGDNVTANVTATAESLKAMPVYERAGGQ